MEMIKGITSHTIVVVVDKDEKAIGIRAVLQKQSHKVFVATSIYEALKTIDQELPHLVIIDALLSDGTAGTLHDRLMSHDLVKNTPILVLVAQKTKEYLTPLKGRKFAGFLLGKVDVTMIANKTTELLESYQDASPYYKPLEKDNTITLSLPATVLGKSNDQIVYDSGFEIDEKAALVCVSADAQRGAALLSLGTNKVKDGQVLNFFPLHRVKGAGRTWLESLPDIAAPCNGIQASHKVLFFDPSVERFEQFQEVLLGYGIELIHASSLQVATALLTRDPTSLDCIFLDELNSSKSGITFKETYAQLDEASRPALLVATSALSAKSNQLMQYLYKPFGLGVLVDMIHSACQKAETLSAKTANDDVKYQAPGTLLGLDETGGIIKLKFPVTKGSKLHLNHKLLQAIWDGDSLVSIEGVGSDDKYPNVWMVKFTAQKAIGNKAKYWSKVKKHLESA